MNRNRDRYRRAALRTICPLLLLIMMGGLWLRAQQRQYALNRQLIDAVVKNDSKRAIGLVYEGADPNTRYDPTPPLSLYELVQRLLHRAPPRVDTSPTALLIVCGARWNNRPATVEMQAYRSDSPGLVRAMLDHDANINVKGKGGNTPLTYAVISHLRDTVQMLLEHGADVNAQRKDGWTALHCAIIWHVDDQDMIRQLLAHGADPKIADFLGKTASYYIQGSPVRNSMVGN